MYVFRSSQEHSALLRAYTLKHCYEESRAIDKSKQNFPDIVSNCLIVRKEKIRN